MRGDHNEGLAQAILAEIESLRAVDCHSHTFSRREYYEKGPYDLFSIPSPFEAWHVFPEAKGPVFAEDMSDGDKWRKLKGLLEGLSNTTMWRHKIVMFRSLFGLEDHELTDDNWQHVNESIREKTRDPGWYDQIVRDECNFETQLRTVRWFEEWDEEYVTPVLWMEPALWLHVRDTPWYYLNEKAAPLCALEERTGISVNSLKAAKEGLAAVTEEYVGRGAAGIKLAYCYQRSLQCQPVEAAAASRHFDAALCGKPVADEQIKAFQDHLIFFLSGLARDMGLVVQIHTGMQHIRANIPDSNPILLIPLLKAFPQVRFDLLHAGYPYSREATMLAKLYPNVWLNMAWVYSGSMSAARHILEEAIDYVPGYRILGFGSDMYYPELVYAHLVMARSCVAEVLAEKVERDFLSAEAAKRLARALFRDTPMALYGL